MAPRQLVRQRDFSGGEVVEYAKRRDDEAAVRASCRTLRNVHILSPGCVEQRPGRSALFQEDGRVDKVRVTADYIIYLCFGDGTLTIRDEDGAVLARAWGYGWDEDTCLTAKWALFDKDIVITFPDQIPKIARWDGDEGWTFLDWAATETAAGRKLVPFYRFARAGITMALSALTGSVSVTFSDNVLVPSHVGTRMRWFDRQITITSVTNGMAGTADIEENLPAIKSQDFTADITATFAVGDVIEGVTSGARFYVAEVGTPGTDDITSIRIGSTIGSGGEIFVGPSGQATHQSDNSDPTTAPAIVVWDEEIMNEFRGWPRSVSVDQNRLIFSDFPGLPEGIAWSASSDASDFYVGADPTDAMFELAPNKSRVYHVSEGADEFVFTDRGVYYIPISESNPLRPGSVAFRKIAGAAASAIAPISTAQGVAYVNNGLNRVLAIVGTGQTAQPYIIRPASDLHSHLFSGIVCLAIYEGDGDPPDEIAFAVNGDGTVVAGRFQPGKEWVGWVKWEGEGAVKWISALGTDVIFTTQYQSYRLCEQLDEATYLDGQVSYDAIPTALGTGSQADLLLPDDQGTPIGDMTEGAGLAAAFDTVTAVTSLSVVTSATSQANGSITAPSGIQAGDLLVLWNVATNVSPPAAVYPSGFVPIVSFTTTIIRASASYKIANGTESGAALSVMTGTVRDTMLYVFRANVPLSVVTVGSVDSEGGDSNPTAQTVAVSGLSPPLLVMGCYGVQNGGTIDPRTFSTTKDGEINSSVRAYLAYKIYNSSPANTDIDMDDEGNSNMLASFYIQAAAPSAQKSASTSGAIGKTFGQAFKIAKAEIWPPTGLGFSDQANVTISLRAKQGTAPTTFASDGTELATTGSISDTTDMQTLTSNDEDTEWDHAWVLITTSSGIQYAAELRFHSAGLTHGSDDLWFHASDTLTIMDGRRHVGTTSVDADGVVAETVTDEELGLPFDPVIEPFVPHMQQGQSIKQTLNNRQISDGAIAVQNSTGFKVQSYNPNNGTWKTEYTRAAYEAGQSTSAQPTLREEVRTFHITGNDHDPRIRIVKDFPGPLRVLEIGVEVDA